MPSLRSLLRRALSAFDRVAGTQLHAGLRSAIRVAGVLAPDLRGRLQMVAAGALLGTRRVHRPLRVRVLGPAGPHPFVLPDVAGLLVLEEIFCDAEYDVPLPRQPRHIVDLGSNIGVSVLFFARRYPQARITAVEASPSLFGVLKANVGDLPNVTLHHAAVGATGEPMTFYEGVSSWAGSTQRSDWVDTERATRVPGLALDDLLAAGDVDLVKFDVEGAEFEMLPASEHLASVPAVLGEIHAPPRTPESERMLALFESFDINSTSPDPSVPQYHTVFSALRS